MDEKQYAEEERVYCSDDHGSRDHPALIGALAVQDQGLNLWVILGLLMILYGVLYHLLMVRCPHCGRSLAGYRPLPRECPYCHEPLEE